MRVPIDPDRAPRAHESVEHLSEKLRGANSTAKFDFDYVLLEHGYSDWIGVRWRGPRPEIIANELERSTRNVIRNIERNAQQGAAGTIVFCPDFAVMAAVARKLAQSLRPALRAQVGLTNLTTLQLLQPGFTHNNPTPEDTDANP